MSSWVKKYKCDGLDSLVRQSRKDKGSLRKQAIVELTEALYLKYPASSCANIYRLLLNYCEKNKITIPSYRNVCRYDFSNPKVSWMKLLLAHQNQTIKRINESLDKYIYVTR